MKEWHKRRYTYIHNSSLFLDTNEASVPLMFINWAASDFPEFFCNSSYYYESFHNVIQGKNSSTLSNFPIISKEHIIPLYHILELPIDTHIYRTWNTFILRLSVEECFCTEGHQGIDCVFFDIPILLFFWEVDKVLYRMLLPNWTTSIKKQPLNTWGKRVVL